jgi:hypothetical protein
VSAACYNSSMTRAAGLSCVLACVASAAAGCGENSCADVEASDASAAPEVVGVKLLEDAVPGDPWELVFVTRFRDSDGDLGNGRADVYLNDDAPPAIKLPMRDIFRQSALSLGAESGVLTLPLRFSDTVPNGASVQMGLMLVDNAGHKSNCYSMDLKFTVQPVATVLGRAYRALAGLFSAGQQHGG